MHDGTNVGKMDHLVNRLDSAPSVNPESDVRMVLDLCAGVLRAGHARSGRQRQRCRRGGPVSDSIGSSWDHEPQSFLIAIGCVGLQREAHDVCQGPNGDLLRIL